jgi:galactokinase
VSTVSFGHTHTVTATAPGRVNLIGEHTDYNGGFVLPTVIARETGVELSPAPDGAVRLVSAAVEPPTAQYRLGDETPRHGWPDYVQGVTALLRAEGQRIGGFHARIDSDVPIGGGLSSSASLTIALLRALRRAFALDLDDIRLARLAQRVENEFVGAHVGIMDPIAVSLGRAGSALFLDTRDLSHEHIPLPAAIEVVVIHSGVSHRLAGGGYNTRRQECERAAALLGVAQLRDVTTDDLPRIAALPDPLNRRARHIVTENARVLAAVAALRAADLPALGDLFAASHASMRDDYEVSIPEIDLLVALATRQPPVIAARLTGGGFGGSIVLLAHAGDGATAAHRIAEEYGRQTGLAATVVSGVQRAA